MANSLRTPAGKDNNGFSGAIFGSRDDANNAVSDTGIMKTALYTLVRKDDNNFSDHLICFDFIII